MFFGRAPLSLLLAVQSMRMFQLRSSPRSTSVKGIIRFLAMLNPLFSVAVSCFLIRSCIVSSRVCAFSLSRVFSSNSAVLFETRMVVVVLSLMTIITTLYIYAGSYFRFNENMWLLKNREIDFLRSADKTGQTSLFAGFYLFLGSHQNRIMA